MSSLENKKNDDAVYYELGKRLKAAREAIGYTLDRMKVESDTARSYINDFEHGRRLPPSKYFYFLSERFGVRMDYIFKGEGDVFPDDEEERFKLMQFGPVKKEIMEMLELIDQVPHALYAVLSFFSRYTLENAAIIEKSLEIKSNISDRN